jgi:hypothetical protein
MSDKQVIGKTRGISGSNHDYHGVFSEVNGN